MAKYYNARVKTGRLAGSVFAVRNGETIERAYQPVVFNPSTPAQVAQRAKLKLMSQLGEVMAPVIAFRKNGSVSARNLFTKRNLGKALYGENQATFPLEQLDLTGGILPLSTLQVERAGNSIQCTVAVGSDLDRVVFASFSLIGNEPRFVGSVVGEISGGSATAVLPNPTNSRYLVVAYGMRDNTDVAKAKYGRMSIPDTNVNAILAVFRSLSESDVSLTETRAAILAEQS